VDHDKNALSPGVNEGIRQTFRHPRGVLDQRGEKSSKYFC
jgi:hypothetical protein